jgi:hypothetical protein
MPPTLVGIFKTSWTAAHFSAIVSKIARCTTRLSIGAMTIGREGFPGRVFAMPFWAANWKVCRRSRVCMPRS